VISRAYLGLGSNIEPRLDHLQRAVDGLRDVEGVTVLAVSRVYETDPVGGPAQGEFLNAVVAIETDLSPDDLLTIAQALEADAQRVRTVRWGPRTLDVDVLLYDGVERHDERLTIPHPRVWERAFVLVPLADVAPGTLAAIVTDRLVGLDTSGVRPVDVCLA